MDNRVVKPDLHEQPPQKASTPAVKLTDLTRKYGSFKALDGINLEVNDGEFFTLLGPSGSGKTTTLRLVAGFDQPDAGSIELAGENIAGRPPFERDVNTVFQDYALFPHMNVADNVAYSLKVRGVARKERRASAEEALDLVQLTGLGSRRPAQLSGGQRQRVALARAIVAEPKVLLLDEPLGALDLKLREQMQAELTSIQRTLGMTFVYVTHDQDEALGMSDRLAVFNHGQIEQIGTPAEIYAHPASEFVAGFVGSSNIIERGGRRFTVRPEQFAFVASSQPASATTRSEPGVVTDRRFLGQTTRWTVDLSEGDSVSVIVQNDGRAGTIDPVPGDTVVVGWEPQQELDLPQA